MRWPCELGGFVTRLASAEAKTSTASDFINTHFTPGRVLKLKTRMLPIAGLEQPIGGLLVYDGDGVMMCFHCRSSGVKVEWENTRTDQSDSDWLTGDK